MTGTGMGCMKLSLTGDVLRGEPPIVVSIIIGCGTGLVSPIYRSCFDFERDSLFLNGDPDLPPKYCCLLGLNCNGCWGEEGKSPDCEVIW